MDKIAVGFGDTGQRSVQGLTPDEYRLGATSRVTVSASKEGDSRRVLQVVVYADDRIVAQQQTDAEYGSVMVSARP